MLKLVKYELIQSWRNFAMVFFGYLVLCALTPLLGFNENMLMIQGILIAILVCTIMGIMFGVFLTVAKNYKNSMFGRNGYLTLTLPVNNHQLLSAKLISSMTWIILSGIVLIVGMFVLVFSIVGFDQFFNGFQEMMRVFGEFIQYWGIEFLQILFLMFMNILAFVLLIFCALSLSHTCWIRNHRVFWAIVIIVLYNIITSTIFGDMPSIFTYGYMTSGTQYLSNASMFNEGYWISVGYATLQSVVLYGLTWFFLEKKVEIQ